MISQSGLARTLPRMPYFSSRTRRGGWSRVFSAPGIRALYADWKGGGQVNFLKPFSEIWAERWKIVSKQQPLDVYARLGIDYVVFRSANRQPGWKPVFQNSGWVVYNLRKTRLPLVREWMPVRLTSDGESRCGIRES